MTEMIWTHENYDRSSHSRRPYVPSRDRQDGCYSSAEKRPRTSVEDIRVQVPAVSGVRAPKCAVAGCGAEPVKNMPCLLTYQECFTQKVGHLEE